MPSTKIINVLRTDKFGDVLDLFKNTEAKDVIFVLPKKARAFSREDHFAELAVEAKTLNKNVSILCQAPEINKLALDYKFVVLNSNTSPSPKRESIPKKPEIQVAKAASPDFHDDTDDEMNTSDYKTFSEDKEDEDNIPKGFHEEDGQAEVDLDSDFVEHPLNKEDADELKEPEESFEEDEADDEADKDHDDKIFEEGEDVLSINTEHPATLAASRNRIVEDIIPPRSSAPVKIQKEDGAKTEKINLQKNDSVPDLGMNEPGALDKIKEVWQSKSSASWNDIPIGKKNESKKSNLFSLPASGGYKKPGSGFAPEKLFRRLAVIIAVCAVVVFGAIIYVTVGKAEIIIKPKSGDLNVTLSVSASDKITEINLENNRIPGQIFQIEKTVQETFPSTGERDVAQKARGTITIYNEYGTGPQALIATTRFQSENGLVFRTLKTVSVPGMKTENGQTTPGSVKVEVVADKAGNEYNIPAGKFTIVAFKEQGDTARYQKIYATSNEPMSGGIVGKAKVVTETDISSAKEAINRAVIEAARKELESQASGLKIISVPLPIIKESVTSAKIDEATDTFTVSATAIVDSMGIRESAIFSLIDYYLKNNGNMLTKPEKVSLNYTNPVLSKDTTTLAFSVTVSGTAYAFVNSAEIIKDLVGKKEKDISEYLKTAEGVGSARVVLRPFWVKRIPEDPTRTTISLDYD